VVLTVENTGEKLTTQLAATLVEPFLRCTKRIRTEHAGVGLGLAVVKSITNAHDGTLTLTARAAGGLRVTVQLPAAPPHWQLTITGIAARPGRSSGSNAPGLVGRKPDERTAVSSAPTTTRLSDTQPVEFLALTEKRKRRSHVELSRRNWSQTAETRFRTIQSNEVGPAPKGSPVDRV
jgi:hypothetical protein